MRPALLSDRNRSITMNRSSRTTSEMPETFHTPAALLRRKSLVPKTGPVQAAFLRRMDRGRSSTWRGLFGSDGWRLGLLLASAIALAPTPADADNGRPNGVETDAEPSIRARYIRARVVHSLETTFVRATDRRLGPALAQVSKRIIVWWLNPRRDLQRGDTIEVVYEPRAGAEPIVKALWLRSQKHGKRFAAVRYRPAGARFYRYYSASGREVERRLKRSPVAQYEQITSLLGDGRGHRGIDFKAPIGTPVLAPFTGVVRRRNWSTRRNGRCLELTDSLTGRRAVFLHLHRIYRRIRPGVRVRAGQKIATLGNSGRSSAPHLHYELRRRNGTILNPLRVHGTWRAKLAPSEAVKARRLLQRFAEMRTRST